MIYTLRVMTPIFRKIYYIQSRDKFGIFSFRCVFQKIKLKAVVCFEPYYSLNNKNTQPKTAL